MGKSCRDCTYSVALDETDDVKCAWLWRMKTQELTHPKAVPWYITDSFVPVAHESACHCKAYEESKSERKQ
jgi:hypothetical protein